MSSDFLQQYEKIIKKLRRVPELINNLYQWTACYIDAACSRILKFASLRRSSTKLSEMSFGT